MRFVHAICITNGELFDVFISICGGQFNFLNRFETMFLDYLEGNILLLFSPGMTSRFILGTLIWQYM